VFATTTSTELFFRQAVGRFVRWQPARGVQKAYVFLPDDPRLRTHAFQIAEARRHVLRPPALHDDEATAERDGSALDEQRGADLPEQLSLFSVLSAVATGMKVHSVTADGVAYDDEPEQPSFASDGIDLVLPDIPTDAGFAYDTSRSNAEVKADLRARLLPRAPFFDPAELIDLADAYARATGHPVQVQWTLLAGINDGDDELDGIVRLLKGKRAILNMIPYNAVDGLDFQRPKDVRANDIAVELHRRGVLTKLRQSAGQDIDGGCGQLRSRERSAANAMLMPKRESTITVHAQEG
jgi:hypothetical protein